MKTSVTKAAALFAALIMTAGLARAQEVSAELIHKRFETVRVKGAGNAISFRTETIKQTVGKATGQRPGSRLGRGHTAAHFAGAKLTPLSRRVTIKTLLVNQRNASPQSLAKHLRYIERDGVSIACEVSVTNTLEYEMKNITKCLRAGVQQVLVLTVASEKHQRLSAAIASLLSPEQQEKVLCIQKDEFEAYLADGTLTKLSTAWSRDQAEKIYVQHRMLENAAELWQWLEEGAHFYVCGDASRMAADVHEALTQVYINHGGLTREAAESELEALKKAKRYQRDVY